MSRLIPTDDHYQNWTPPLSWYQSRAYWREVADQLLKNPKTADAALSQAHRLISQRLEDPQWQQQKAYYQGWHQLLEQGVQAVVKVLIDPSDEWPQAMRSTFPLFGVLSAKERWDIFNQVRSELKSREKTPV